MVQGSTYTLCSKYSPQSNFRKIIYIKIIFFNGAVCELIRLASCNIALCRKYIKDVNKVQIYICNVNCIILACIPACCPSHVFQHGALYRKELLAPGDTAVHLWISKVSKHF